jgi:hypothetical protein
MSNGRGELRMTCLQEPDLADMLADSIVRAVMDADRVDPRALAVALRETAVLWRAAQGEDRLPDGWCRNRQRQVSRG